MLNAVITVLLPPFADSSGVREIAVVKTKGMLNAVMTIRCFPSTIATKQIREKRKESRVHARTPCLLPQSPVPGAYLSCET